MLIQFFYNLGLTINYIPFMRTEGVSTHAVSFLYKGVYCIGILSRPIIHFVPTKPIS
jgi:hypothetical protein